MTNIIIEVGKLEKTGSHRLVMYNCDYWLNKECPDEDSNSLLNIIEPVQYTWGYMYTDQSWYIMHTGQYCLCFFNKMNMKKIFVYLNKVNLYWNFCLIAFIFLTIYKGQCLSDVIMLWSSTYQINNMQMYLLASSSLTSLKEALSCSETKDFCWTGPSGWISYLLCRWIKHNSCSM